MEVMLSFVGLNGITFLDAFGHAAGIAVARPNQAISERCEQYSRNYDTRIWRGESTVYAGWNGCWRRALAEVAHEARVRRLPISAAPPLEFRPGARRRHWPYEADTPGDSPEPFSVAGRLT